MVPLTRQQDIEAHLEEQGLNEDDQERQEFERRMQFGKCTCDLLDPLGHVVCPACNEGF